jgi:hypothetical protein
MNELFPISSFWPVAIGFFGLGTNYFVQGGTALFKGPNWSKDSRQMDKTVALWGIFFGGLMQFVTGTYIMIGLSWFPVYRNAAPLYMAAVAFTAYGIHWFILGIRRYVGAESGPEAWMAIGMLVLSVLGLVSFWGNGDIPVAILFAGLSLIYISEIVANTSGIHGHKAVGFFMFLTGIWLMYLTVAVTLDFANKMHIWV